jgi:hypothetical protein
MRVPDTLPEGNKTWTSRTKACGALECHTPRRIFPLPGWILVKTRKPVTIIPWKRSYGVVENGSLARTAYLLKEPGRVLITGTFQLHPGGR